MDNEVISKDQLRAMSLEEWQNLDIVQFLADNTPYFITYYLKKLCSAHQYDMSFEEAQSILIVHCTSRLQSVLRRNPDATGQRRVVLLYGTVSKTIKTEIRRALFVNYFNDAFVDSDAIFSPTRADIVGSVTQTQALHAASMPSVMTLTSHDYLISCELFEKRLADEQELSNQIESLRSLPEMVDRPKNRYTAKNHEIFRMRALDSLSPQQIAEKQGVTQNYINKVHKRVMSLLKEVAHECNENRRPQAKI